MEKNFTNQQINKDNWVYKFFHLLSVRRSYRITDEELFNIVKRILIRQLGYEIIITPKRKLIRIKKVVGLRK